MGHTQQSPFVLRQGNWDLKEKGKNDSTLQLQAIGRQVKMVSLKIEHRLGEFLARRSIQVNGGALLCFLSTLHDFITIQVYVHYVIIRIWWCTVQMEI